MASILLVDVDSTIPNLALMRLSAYHKSLGDSVRIERLSIPYYPNRRQRKKVTLTGVDRVYVSAIFKGTFDYVDFLGPDVEIVKGGTGIDLITVLPLEVEASPLDYSIYPDNDTAYGFISRGCNRACAFCFVPQKEGSVRQVELSPSDIIGGFGKVKFLDNNFLQLPNHMSILRELVDLGVKCQFNQGLDIRLISEANSELLGRLNYIGEYLFAFDDFRYKNFIARKLDLLRWLRPWKAKFFVYVHPDMEFYETVRRVSWLKSKQLLPYVMRDISCWGSEHHEFFVDIAAYCNQPNIFKKMSFYEYCDKRAISQKRRELHKSLWREADYSDVAIQFDKDCEGL